MKTVVTKGNTFLSVIARANQLDLPVSHLLEIRPLEVFPTKDEFDSYIEETKPMHVTVAVPKLWFLGRMARAVWNSNSVEEGIALREMEKRLIRLKQNAKTAGDMRFVYGWAENSFPVRNESAEALETMLLREIPGSDYQKLETIRKLALGETLHQKVYDAIRNERAKIAWAEIQSVGSDTKKLWKIYFGKKHGGNSYLALDPIIEHTSDISELKQIPIRVGEPQYKVQVLHHDSHPLSWTWKKVWKKIVSLTEDVDVLFEAIEQASPQGDNDFVLEVGSKILQVFNGEDSRVTQRVLEIYEDRKLRMFNLDRINNYEGHVFWQGIHSSLKKRAQTTKSPKEARIIYDVARRYQKYHHDLGPYFQVQVVAVIDRLTPIKA